MAEEDIPVARPVSISEIIDAAVTQTIQSPATLLSENWKGLVVIACAILFGMGKRVRGTTPPSG